jgi:hypothetical protein
MMDPQTKKRFSEMLPWYVNGTLEDESRQWFEAQLTANPELRSELSWTQSLQQRICESIPEVSPELGLDKLMARIRHERTAISATRAPVAAEKVSLMDRIAGFFAGFRLTPAFAAAAAIVAVQAGVIGMLVNEQAALESEFATYRSTGEGHIATGPVLEVVFKADARERELRELLVRIGGTLAGGPGQLGTYLIYVPAEHLDEAQRVLAADAAVEAVSVSRSEPAKR